MEKGTYMSTSELVVAISVFILAGVMLIIGIMHFMEQGLLLNNSYLYASKEERASMNKKLIFAMVSSAIISKQEKK